MSTKDLNKHTTTSEILSTSEKCKVRKSTTKCKPARKWVDVELRSESNEEVSFKVRNITEPRTAIIDKMVAEGSSPLQFFQLFWDIEIMQKICTESQKYAKYKYGDNNFTLDIEDLHKFFAILLVSG